MMFVTIGFSTLTGNLAWKVLSAGLAISLFCAGFYLVSLGLKDVAFSGHVERRPGWAQRSRQSGTTVI